MLCEEGFPHTAAVESCAPSVFHFLTAGATVLVHHHRILARGIKIAWLQHPTVQFRTIGQCEGEELLFRANLLHSLGQIAVVDQGFLRVSGRIAQRGHRRLPQSRIHVHEVAHVGGERRVVRATFGRETRRFSELVRRIHGCAQRTLLVCGIVEAAVALVVSIKIAHLEIASCHRGLQLAVERVPIEVLVAGALGEQGEVPGIEAQGRVSLLAKIALVGFAQRQFRHTAARVHHVEVHAVLMSVECHDGQTFGVGGADDARHVAVGIQGDGQFARGAAQQVVAVHTHFRVFGAGNGVFVIVGARIFGILFEFRLHALEHLHAIDGHFRLVVAHPAEHLAVGREIEGASRAKLLFVHPIGDTVEHLVALAVGGDAGFGVAVQEFHDEEVVVARKGHNIAVGREEGRHLGAAFRERLVLAVGHIVDVINRLRGAPIDRSGVRAEQYLLFVGTHDVAVDALEFGRAASFAEIEEHARFLSRLERRAGDAPTVGRKL